MNKEHKGQGVKQSRKPLQRLPRTNVPQPHGAHGAPPPGYITIGEACKRLSRHQQTVYRYIRRGLLRVKLVGWRVFVEEKSVEWWLKPRLYEPRRPAPPWLRKPGRRAEKRQKPPEQETRETPRQPSTADSRPEVTTQAAVRQ